jgi:histidinol-phosphate aminotransferase
MAGVDSLSALAASPVGELAPYQPGKPLEELEREYGIRDAIKLASNENPHELPASVRTALRAALDDVARYPDGACYALRAAVAEHLQVAPGCLTFGNGSNDVLVLLAETFLTPQVSAVYDQYSFVVYRLAVQATGAIAKVSPANARDHAQPLGHDLDAMLALVDAQTRLVFIANPNNPTGTWLDGGSLYRFLQQLPAHVIAVIDEAYYEYACIHPGNRSGDEYPDVCAWLDEFPNLVITRTFSKAYGLAGLRVGYCVSSPEIAELLNRVRQPFNVNSVAQAAALAALSEQEWLQTCCRENNAELDRMTVGLQGMGIACLPSRGNFLLAEIAAAGECYEFLLRQGIIVRPVANYGLPEYLRLSIGSANENYRLLAALARYMEARR